jgi:hypothetical protein
MSSAQARSTFGTLKMHLQFEGVSYLAFVVVVHAVQGG